MPTVFIDTSYVIALINTRDPHREAALAWRDRIKSEAWEQVTTTAILLEFGEGAVKHHAWDLASPLLEAMMADPRVTIMEASCSLIERARKFRDEREDKDWGLVDCISFLAMKERGLREALTADRHYEQAGYRRLLLEKP